MSKHRTVRLMVNMYPDIAERVQREIDRRPRYISVSAFLLEALEFYLAACESERSQSANEHPAGNAPQNAQNGPRSVCHLREV